MVKQHADAIIVNAGELLTLKGPKRPRTGPEMSDLGIIKDGAVAIKGGRIATTGSSKHVMDQFAAKEIVNASGKTVMPGFVDPHTHAVFAGSREHELEMKIRGATYMKILRGGGGILRTVQDTRKITEEHLFANSKTKLESMLIHGTTTVEIKSGYGLTVESENKCLRTISKLKTSLPMNVVSTFLGAHTVPEEYADRTDDYLRLVTQEMIPSVAANKLAEFCDVPCEKGFFNPEQARKILLTGKDHGLSSKVHADEFAPSGGAAVAADVEATSADHLIYSPLTEIKRFSNTVAVLLPAASFSLFMKDYAKAREVIDADVPVALGSDFSPSCWNLNQQMTIALACYELKLTPAECISATTINAAHAINRATEVGSLEPRKSADIIVLNVPNHNFLGYGFGINAVTDVFVKGKHVVDHGTLSS